MSTNKKIQLLNAHRLRLIDVLSLPGGSLYRQYLGREIRQQIDFTSREIKEADIKPEKENGKVYLRWKKQCPKEIELDSSQRAALVETFADLPAEKIDQVIVDMVFQLVENREELERILKVTESTNGN